MTRFHKSFWALSIALFLTGLSGIGQRSYAPHSVLSSGNWFRMAVSGPGVYKMDLAFLSKLGINTSNLPSSSIRLFGNGGFMLPEAASGPKKDDLFENAIWVEDGGDGVLNGTDYILFYASGPHGWTTDTLNRKFTHKKNLYSEKSYYYITVGTAGKRINTATNPGLPTTTINSYNGRYYYELDTFNFLSSGKQWYGEEFSNLPGKSLSRTYPVNIGNLSAQPGTVLVNAAARSFGSGSHFAIKAGNQDIPQLDIPAVGNGAYDFFAQETQVSSSFIPSAATINLKLDYAPGSTDSQGWLNWFEVHARADLSMKGLNQLLFRDWNSVASGNTGNFIMADAASLFQVWDISDPLQPIKMQGNLSGTNWQFVNDCSRLHEYIAFTQSGYLVPEALGKQAVQDLHGSLPVNYIIITGDELLAQANRLADFHKQKEGLTSLVVTASQVFNEFSSGSPDPTALRDFVKMFYDRAGTDTTLRPRYLLLFGDASFDYKDRIKNNTNKVPSYESDISLDPLNTYTSDDFFGFLDDAEDINSASTSLLDIGIGRIPANTIAEAQSIVDKIIVYTSPTALGPWRNELSFFADDEDGNLHLNDAEIITAAAETTAPVLSIDKIYLDAFKQESGTGGSRYPDVNRAVLDRVNNGTLIWNYSGHGSYRRLAEEVVLDQDVINSFKNPFKLPLFITATCDVAPYDNPLIQSIGENLLLRPKTGAIALMTTTRLVFAFSNRIMNKNYLEAALKRQTDGSYPTLGDAVKRAKNFTYTFFGDAVNNRKFTLLGDPALTLALPSLTVATTAINGLPVSATPDTLKALSTYTINGEVSDAAGQVQNNFKGTVYLSVFDKKQTRATLGNDPGSPITNFTEQKNALFKGKATVEQGKFKISFIVPKDIDYRFGKGKISFYTENGLLDGNGADVSIIVGGTGTGNGDIEGPVMKAWLNDEKFVDGSITNSAPVLLVKLLDSSGINILGAGIGHDLEAELDGDSKQRFVLNDFYESELDNYKKGAVRFQLPALEEGLHSLRIKAWDVMNNSSEITVSFRVVKEKKFTLDHVLNYPNPFTTHTSFWFEHNRPGEELRVTVQVFTVSGRLVKTLRNTIFSTGNRSVDVEWDGRDEYGSRIGRGVYIYRLKVQTSDGNWAEKWEKLYIM